MKRTCIAGLLTLASWSIATSTAHAQYAAPTRPYLQPLPPVTTTSSGLRAAAYNTEPEPAPQPANSAPAAAKPGETYNSAFPTAPPPTAAAPDADSPAAAPTEYEKALHSTCWDDCDSPECTCSGGFFAAAGGIVMTRNRANAISVTYESGTTTPLMNTQDAAAGWAGGGQVTLGYAFGGPGGPGSSGQWGAVGATAPAVAFTWWGTGEMNGFASVNDPGNLTASFNIPGVTFTGGQLFTDYFDNASEQRLWRTDIVNNIEANVFDGTLFNSSHLQVIALAGFRYFRFSERVIFGSAINDFGDNGGADEAYFSSACLNSMYGGQIGAIFNFMAGERWSWFITPKVGLFGNEMTTRTRLYRGDGDEPMNILLTKSDFAMLCEIETGLTYTFGPHWRTFVGYRVVGVSNVALSDNQFSPDLGDIKQAGSLILHGGFAGLIWTY